MATYHHSGQRSARAFSSASTSARSYARRSVLTAHETTVMNTRRRSDAELDALIDEITVDCHDEDEQLSAFDNAF